MTAKKLRVAILGSGNIGTDLLVKVMRSPYLECALFIGRSFSSPGMTKAKSLGVRVSDRGIEAICDDPKSCELVFDATDAVEHHRHWLILQRLGKTVIDMTPSKTGMMCIPAINLEQCLNEGNVSMVTCGGQAVIPLVHALSRTHETVEYIEVVSSIASKSSGRATRFNIDEYVETTEEAIRAFSGCRRSKAILIQNPAEPCVDMQTTLFAKLSHPQPAALERAVKFMVDKIQGYVPGYELVIGPVFQQERLVIMVKVRGLGDYLPRYAGNLDIMTCAAIVTAEAFAKRHAQASVVGAS